MYRLAFVDAQHALGDLGAAFEHAAASPDEADSLHEVVVQVATLNTCLEVLALLDEQGRAAALMAPLEPEVLGQMPQLRDDLGLSRAKVALLRHDTGAAAQALTQISEETTNGRISAFRALLRAELALAQGDAAASIKALNSRFMGHS